jgi:hypothetical protein
MLKIFINAGGSSQYDQIAKQYGWKLGINSGGKARENIKKLFMIDNNWSQYNHEQHLACVRRHCPHLATVRDIEYQSNQEKILEQAYEISQYCDRVVVIPKTKILVPELLKLPNMVLGLPLGRGENTYSWHYALTQEKDVHLLGGSPMAWVRAIQQLNEKVYSYDGNYLSKIAKFGKVYSNWRSRKPFPYEVPCGENFNYRCFEFSLLSLSNIDLKTYFPSRQLSLFQTEGNISLTAIASPPRSNNSYVSNVNFTRKSN